MWYEIDSHDLSQKCLLMHSSEIEWELFHLKYGDATMETLYESAHNGGYL